MFALTPTTPPKPRNERQQHSSGPQPRTTRRCHPPTWPNAGSRRRWIRKNPCPHTPHSPPHRERQHQPIPNTRHHLHQQSSTRNEGSSNGTRRPGRRKNVGIHIPFRLRPDSPARCRTTWLPQHLFDLRPSRRSPSHRICSSRPRARHKKVCSSQRPLPHIQPQERTCLDTTSTRQSRRCIRSKNRRNIRGISTSTSQLRSNGLRRSTQCHRRTVQHSPPHPQPLSGTLPTCTCRRVPGHEPGTKRHRLKARR